MGDPAEEVCARTEGAWRAFRDATALADPDSVTSAGWSVKAMVAHVAFWMETVPPFVTGAFRGDPTAFEVTFPSGYVAGEGDWPGADVHNEREAAWAAGQPMDVVIARADRAFGALEAFFGTVTDAEAAAQAVYFEEVAAHLDEHRLAELNGRPLRAP